MNVKFSILCAFILICSSLKAQNKVYNFNESPLKPFFIEVEAYGTTKSKNLGEIGLNLNLELDITKQFYLMGVYTFGKALQDRYDVKSYFDTQSVGGGLGYRLFKLIGNKKNERPNIGSVDLRANVLTHVGDVDWKKTTYNIGFVLVFKNKLSPIISLGYRHNQSHTRGIPNTNSVYGEIGIRF